jgi:hypothetical protein
MCGHVFLTLDRGTVFAGDATGPNHGAIHPFLQPVWPLLSIHTAC